MYIHIYVYMYTVRIIAAASVDERVAKKQLSVRIPERLPRSRLSWWMRAAKPAAAAAKGAEPEEG